MLKKIGDLAQGWPFVLLNAAMFAVLAHSGFDANKLTLFFAFDGNEEAWIIDRFLHHSQVLFGYSANYLQGLGNIEFTVNALLSPCYALTGLLGPLTTDTFPTLYTIVAVELFLGMVLFGAAMGIHRLAGTAAAWVLAFLTWQFVYFPPLVFNNWRAFPHYGELVVVMLLMAAAFVRIGRGGVAGSLAWAVAVFAAITYLLVVSPMAIVLLVPFPAVVGLLSIAAARGRERRHKLAATAAILAACAAGQYVQYLLGLFTFTAAYAFPVLSLQSPSLTNVSLLFWEPFTSWRNLLTPTRELILGGLLGAVWMSWGAAGNARLMARAALLCEVSFLALGLIHTRHPFWPGPAFWYYEDFVLPVLALCAFAAPWMILAWLGRAITRRLSHSQGICLASMARLAVVVLLTLWPWSYLMAARKATAGSPPNILTTRYPQPETPITALLTREIALADGMPFRGRVATMTGRLFPDMHDWYGEWGEMYQFSLWATGNYHEGSGLWAAGIPTLTEYNQFMTPAYWAFVRMAFTDPEDREIRNIIATRRVDRRLLAAAGVSFVTTDVPIPEPARLRDSLRIPVSAAMTHGHAPLRRIVQRVDHIDLQVYELPGANVGNYSPTEIRQVATAAEALAALRESALDPARVAITHESVPESLVPADSSPKMMVEPGGLRIVADSRGTSMLLLPVEFSRCLSLRGEGGSDSAARLVRADLVMTGLIFSGRLDAHLRYYTGPFHNQSCRLDDAKDMKAMSIADAFASMPEYAPRAEQ